MFLETGDLEAVPIILTMALAKDGEWHVEIEHSFGKTEGELLIADWTNVYVRNEAGATEVIAWDAVEKVTIP